MKSPVSTSGRRIRRLSTIAIVGAVFAVAPDPLGGQTAVIVNRANPTMSVSTDELRRYYLGSSTTFPDGGAHVALVESPALRASFYKKVLGMNEDRVSRHWISIVFAGRGGTTPRTFSDVEEAKRYVSHNAGAIAFIPARSVDTTVKVLAIDGRQPADPAYGLR